MRRILILTWLCSILAISVFAQEPQTNRGSSTGVAYTMTVTATTRYVDGRTEAAYTAKRYASSSGTWRMLKIFASGKVEELFADPNHGLFKVDRQNNKMQRLHQHEGSQHSSHPHPVATEQTVILGHSVYVDRFDNGKVRVEIYRAPDLNNAVLKTVRQLEGRTEIAEVTEIKLGEPSEQNLKHPDFPTDNSE